MKRSELETKTVKELQVLAREANVAGRSKMRKDELINALAEPESETEVTPTPATEPEVVVIQPADMVDAGTITLTTMPAKTEGDDGEDKPRKMRSKRKRDSKKEKRKKKIAALSRKKNRRKAA